MGTNLVTRAEYKAYANLVSPTEDTKIDTLLPKVSALIKSICRRSFNEYVDDAKVEYNDGGTKWIIPEEYPVILVSSLEYSADFGKTYTPLVEFTDYAFSKMTQSIISVSASIFKPVPNGYKITYTAGYETLPEDLKLAIFDLITYYMKNDMAVHSNKAPGGNTVQIEYITNTHLPAHIKRVLDQYSANYS